MLTNLGKKDDRWYLLPAFRDEESEARDGYLLGSSQDWCVMHLGLVIHTASFLPRQTK